jgi:sugar lactone lactonase YvrE
MIHRGVSLGLTLTSLVLAVSACTPTQIVNIGSGTVSMPGGTQVGLPSSIPGLPGFQSPAPGQSAAPSADPSGVPSQGPTTTPTTGPSATPTETPSVAPTATPSVAPTATPTPIASYTPRPYRGIQTTVAGKGLAGYFDGSLADALFNTPTAMVFDSHGNILVADKTNHRIRKISVDGQVTTLAGSGTPGFVNGYGAAAQLYNPLDLAIDANDNLYILDQINKRVRHLTPDGHLTTLPGQTTPVLYAPLGLALDRNGDVLVADGDRIARLNPTTGVLTNIAGTTTSAGYNDGTLANAKFSNPSDLVVDHSGVIYIADTGNHRIRKITTDGLVSTLAGNGSATSKDGVTTMAGFSSPRNLVLDKTGYLYVIDTSTPRMRQVTPSGIVTTVTDESGTMLTLAGPQGVAIDTEGYLYYTSTTKHTIYKVE